jgi:nicotinamidase-related amidase
MTARLIVSDSHGQSPHHKEGHLMPSQAVRDPFADHLITPQNAAFVLIDYQQNQIGTVRSMDPDLLLENIVSTVKLAKLFGLPIVHSTVGVAAGRDESTVPELGALLVDDPPIDRTAINSWEDADFLAAVRATGRRKLILCALWTEVCMAFPALDAIREAYEVYPVVDAIGGTSLEAHRAGLERVVQAGGQPTAGCRSRASCSATGPASRRFPTSSRSWLTDRLLAA